MLRSLPFLAMAVWLTLASAPSAAAQGHDTPALNTCIHEFYDAEMYNYLTFKNNCSQSLTIVFVAKAGTAASSTMDLRPGAKDSLGMLPGGKPPKIGDYQLYVCPMGYIPTDES